MATQKDLSELYLAEMAEIRATHAGTAETSYYPALSNLLNGIGEKLSPKVCCVIQLQNKGAGMPDGGMFTADQFKTKVAKQNPGKNPLSILPPSRGVIEVKSPAEDMQSIIDSEQINRYWDRYDLVLITNYREFSLIGRTVSGQAVGLESFSLAETEAEIMMENGMLSWKNDSAEDARLEQNPTTTIRDNHERTERTARQNHWTSGDDHNRSETHHCKGSGRTQKESRHAGTRQRTSIISGLQNR